MYSKHILTIHIRRGKGVSMPEDSQQYTSLLLELITPLVSAVITALLSFIF